LQAVNQLNYIHQKDLIDGESVSFCFTSVMVKNYQKIKES